MLTNCLYCTKSFNMYYRKGMTKYIPQVCSGACFKSLLDTHKRDVLNLDICCDDRIKPFSERSRTFRSNYESAFAMRLLLNNINHIYEPYIVNLSDGSRYVPDFYLPNYQIFCEVKGLWEAGAKKKFKKFIEEFNFTIFLIDLKFIQILNK